MAIRLDVAGRDRHGRLVAEGDRRIASRNGEGVDQLQSIVVVAGPGELIPTALRPEFGEFPERQDVRTRVEHADIRPRRAELPGPDGGSQGDVPRRGVAGW
jgi:hypothetical protein